MHAIRAFYTFIRVLLSAVKTARFSGQNMTHAVFIYLRLALNYPSCQWVVKLQQTNKLRVIQSIVLYRWKLLYFIALGGDTGKNIICR